MVGSRERDRPPPMRDGAARADDEDVLVRHRSDGKPSRQSLAEPGAVAEQEPSAAGSTRGEDAIARLDLVRMRDKGGFDADALQRGRHDGSGTGSLKMLPSQRREIVA